MAEYQQMSIPELVAEVRETYGLSYHELGTQLGRSERMMRKLARGETSGESFRSSLTELHEEGHVVHQPPRQRNRDGSLRKVRAKAGSEQKSYTPQDTRGEPQPSVQRGRYRRRATQNLPGGTRIDSVRFPRSKRAPTRKRGLDDIKGVLSQAGRGQNRADKRIRMDVIVENAAKERRKFSFGHHSGYHVSDVLTDLRKDHKGNVEEWMSTQMTGAGNHAGKSAPQDMTGWDVVGADITTFNASRPKSVRQQQDYSGGRRWGKKRR